MPEPPTPQAVVTHHAAAASGRLVLVDDCLRLEASHGASYLLVPPPEVGLAVEGDSARFTWGLVSGDHWQTLLPLGKSVRLGGGEGGLAGMDAAMQQQLAHCSGPYLVIGATATHLIQVRSERHVALALVVVCSRF